MPARVLNGTTRNGSGGGDTIDDGKTFRGYGNGDWLTAASQAALRPPRDSHLFSHSDARASQHYTVLAAYADRPGKFEKIAAGSKQSGGGAPKSRLKMNAKKVVAIRFEFQDGPLGFNVYREINVIGEASSTSEDAATRRMSGPGVVAGCCRCAVHSTSTCSFDQRRGAQP